MDQHELMIRVLVAAGGTPIESLVAPGYTGKIADIFFARDDVIVEVKSITTDRAASDEVAGAVGEMFATHAHLGAPIIFGTMTVSPHDLPHPIAANMMRIVGKRVLAEAKNANAQIKATKTMLGRPHAIGVLALITPPFRLDRRSIVWCMGDAMREGRNSGVDELLLVETPLHAPRALHRDGNSFLSRHTRPEGGKAMPERLAQEIGQAWGKVTRQPRGEAEEEIYHRLGATS